MLQLQHHMTSLTITDRMRRAKSLGAIMQEMAGKLKSGSNKPEDSRSNIVRVWAMLIFGLLNIAIHTNLYQKLAGTSGRINTGELDPQSRNSEAKRMNGRNLTCKIQLSYIAVGSKQ
ncbi:MAG: hypothetical protein AUI97_05755 [Crenarchaeota archaeon 13_1_40CM_3_52_17]|nr:MAG: hypothetical protein AUI97_05755 [Crenarchaeota archaeon 13_1_40CM_3_52_17]